MVNLSRFRRRRDQPVPRFYDKPSRERHFLSIISSALSMVLLIMALALREWAKAGDEYCDFTFGLIKVYVLHKDGLAGPTPGPIGPTEYSSKYYHTFVTVHAGY